MNFELEELRRQKKEIEAKIRALTADGVVRCASAKLDKEHFPTSKPDEWFIAIETTLPSSGKKVWRSILRNENKQTVIDQLPFVINDLEELRIRLAKFG